MIHKVQIIHWFSPMTHYSSNRRDRYRSQSKSFPSNLFWSKTQEGIYMYYFSNRYNRNNAHFSVSKLFSRNF